MSEEKLVTAEELQANCTKEKLYILIHGNVYDVTKFLDEHPGGDEVILAEKGHDATEAFEDVGHSDEARALLPDLLVGKFSGDLQETAKQAAADLKAGASATVNKAPAPGTMSWILPLAFLGAYLAWRFYFSA